MVIVRQSETSVHHVQKGKVAVFNTNIEMNQGETKGTVLFTNADELENYTKSEEAVFEGFIKENVAELRRIRPLDEEQDVAFTHLFQKMMKLFEARISQYVDAKGFTVEQFYDQCRTITESKEEVSEDLEDQLWFVQQLLACTTYEKFHEIVSNAIAGRETKLCTK